MITMRDDIYFVYLKHMPFDKWLPKSSLIIGSAYLCKARNFHIGTWNGVSFDYIRVKWGRTFPDTEFHWDDGPPFGTVRPLEIID